VRGVGVAGRDKTELPAGPGTAVYIPKGVPHWFRNPGAEEVEIVGCYAPAGSLEQAGYVLMRDS
jgi:mannose-6-phosphate isomerase-like protein (cupin superfamily)